jgi:hypothetical protein
LQKRPIAWFAKKMEAWLKERLLPAVMQFLSQPVTPERMLEFERHLNNCLRELGRQLLEWTVNACEPEEADESPHDVKSGTTGYRRLREKTPNRHVATLFGTIILWRRGYRSWDRGDGEPVLFPLELQLGLVEGVTPALADRIGRRMAEAGATQQTVLDWLGREHDVAMGVARLRRLVDQLAENRRHCPGKQQEIQKKVVELLNEAPEGRALLLWSELVEAELLAAQGVRTFGDLRAMANGSEISRPIKIACTAVRDASPCFFSPTRRAMMAVTAMESPMATA